MTSFTSVKAPALEYCNTWDENSSSELLSAFGLGNLSY